MSTGCGVKKAFERRKNRKGENGGREGDPKGLMGKGGGKAIESGKKGCTRNPLPPYWKKKIFCK